MRAPSSRLINDIRCLAATRDPRNGLSIEASSQAIFETKLHHQHISERFFWKLREGNFLLEGFSEIHIQFIPSNKSLVLKVSDDGVHKWRKDVYFTYDYLEWESSSFQQQEVLLTEFIATACLEFADTQKYKLIKKIESELLIKGEAAPITIYTKDMKKYRADISCYIPSRKEPVTCWLEYEDKKANKVYKRDFITLERVSDVSLICGKIIVKPGEIIISPKTGRMAQLVANDYDTPFVIALKDMVLI